MHIICIRDLSLVQTVHGRSLVVHCTDNDDIGLIVDSVREKNTLHALWVHSPLTLSDIKIPESWMDIPIMLECSDMGNFLAVREKLAILRSPAFTVYFPASVAESYTSVNILSSLGVRCGITFSKGWIDWERLNDLLHYAVYSRAKHASIEPFDTIVRLYEPFKTVRFDTAYHNSPETYLHLSKDGKVAFTSEDAVAGNFCDHSFDEIETIEESQQYQNKINEWQNHFLEFDECSCCQAWRLCMGKFSGSSAANPGCKSFFAELMNASEYFYALRKNQSQVENPACR